jgi:acetyltransferase-like isoleucine patch superfamily enzyme
MIWKLKKRLSKFFAKIIPGNSLRCFFWKASGINIGNEVYIGEDMIVIDELNDRGHIKIGDRVAIAERVTLVISSFPNNSRIIPLVGHIHGKIEIKHDAWLGTGCIILPNVTIGEGAVVGAGAVVTKDVPDYSVVTGMPAKIKRSLIDDDSSKTIIKEQH